MKITNTEKLLDIIKTKGIISSKDVSAFGISRSSLPILCRRGKIQRISRGVYMSVDINLTEHHSFAEASKRIPQGVICLFSALTFHQLTTQNPSKLWIAIDRKARLPNLDIKYVNIVRFSGEALNYGIEEHIIEGVKVRIYNPAKTVVDCFKYRNKIGQDTAMEALRDCWNQKKATMDELWNAAKVCRMTNIMRPYLETLV